MKIEPNSSNSITVIVEKRAEDGIVESFRFELNEHDGIISLNGKTLEGDTRDLLVEEFQFPPKTRRQLRKFMFWIKPYEKVK